jgi:hypothetical protein
MGRIIFGQDLKAQETKVKLTNGITSNKKPSAQKRTLSTKREDNLQNGRKYL